MPEIERKPYCGSHLYNCRARSYDWSSTWAVIVSGDGMNFCGHTLLQVGNDRFHIDGPNEFPWYLSPAGYRRYLLENGKRQLRADRIHIPDPGAAQIRLEELTARRWLRGGVAHHCATFVQEIIRSGGSRVGLRFG